MKLKPNDEVIFGVTLKHDIDDWDLCTLDLSVNEQLAVIREIYSRMGFFTEFMIDSDVFICFLWRCHYYYSRNQNPFHNFFHGVTVCHAGYYFATKIEILKQKLQPHQKFAFITACLAHDLDHRGKNNAFELSSCSELAIRYFEKSPLENHHAAIFFKIVNYEDSNILVDVPDDKLKDIKLSIIENILATDMKQHVPIISEFKKRLLNSIDICKK